MNVIGVACSCLPKSQSQKAVKAFLQGAEETGHNVMLVPIGKRLSGCTGCHACKKLDSFCVQQDALCPYFDALPNAGAVVFGAGIYMGYPQGEAWSFMNRHFCLHDKVGSDARCKIEPGKSYILSLHRVRRTTPGTVKTMRHCFTPLMAGALRTCLASIRTHLACIFSVITHRFRLPIARLEALNLHVLTKNLTAQPVHI